MSPVRQHQTLHDGPSDAGGTARRDGTLIHLRSRQPIDNPSSTVQSEHGSPGCLGRRLSNDAVDRIVAWLEMHSA